MKPTRYDEMASLNKLEDIFAFFGDPKKPMAVLQEVKQEKEAAIKALKDLDLGNTKKGLDEAVKLARGELDNVLGDVEAARKEKQEILESANTEAAEIRQITENGKTELEEQKQEFENTKIATESRHQEAEKVLAERNQKANERDLETARLQKKAQDTKDEYQRRINNLEAAATGKVATG